MVEVSTKALSIFIVQVLARDVSVDACDFFPIDKVK
jgi:hypothetical protein